MSGVYFTEMTAVKRPYRSPVREARASRTRAAIVEAAGRLLAKGGLAHTTIDAIATEAGVSVQTVYATFGSKPGILRALLDRLEDEADPARLADDLQSAGSPPDQARALAGYHRRLFQRGADVIAASVGSVAVDPDVAQHVRTGHDRRRAAQRDVIRHWQRVGALREGVGPAEAGDVLWALTGPELYLLHVGGSGWSPTRYERWLADSIVRLILGA